MKHKFIGDSDEKRNMTHIFIFFIHHAMPRDSDVILFSFNALTHCHGFVVDNFPTKPSLSSFNVLRYIVVVHHKCARKEIYFIQTFLIFILHHKSIIKYALILFIAIISCFYHHHHHRHHQHHHYTNTTSTFNNNNGVTQAKVQIGKIYRLGM